MALNIFGAATTERLGVLGVELGELCGHRGRRLGVGG